MNHTRRVVVIQPFPHLLALFGAAEELTVNL